jgi:hypothetical protein
MSHHIAKLFGSPLVLASAALVIHIGTASAADSKADIQQQVREMLSGTPTTHFVPQSGQSDSKATTPAVDSQEFVKQLLLGATASRVRDAQMINHSKVAAAPGNTELQQRPVARADIQAAMRRLLMGQPHASDAS